MVSKTTLKFQGGDSQNLLRKFVTQNIGGAKERVVLLWLGGDI